MPCLVLHFSLLFVSLCCGSTHLLVEALYKAGATKLCTDLLLEKKLYKFELGKKLVLLLCSQD